MNKVWNYIQAIFMLSVLFAALGLIVGFFAGVTWWFARVAFLLLN